MGEPDYSEISPRMRRLVRLLRGWGYETTDSGDGTSELECAIPWPSVGMVVRDPDQLVFEASRLAMLLRQQGIEVVPMRLDGGAAIQAGYCPAAQIATILLTGVTDEDLGT